EILDQLGTTFTEDERPLADEGRTLSACVDKLAPKQRELLRQRYEFGTSLKELSQLLSRSVGAINMQLVRIRQILLDCTERTTPRATCARTSSLKASS
ncbi:MAG: hypothetical protein IH924_10935, partial [Proteobacteria bacterium]|nr:hypothetical protein [Pseudomonadota bacterium]